MARILVVDDDGIVRTLVGRMLSDAGHDVQAVPGPVEALELCRWNGCFDVVITDVVMPEMNGHELTQRLASHFPGTRVLHISGYDPGCDRCPYMDKCPLILKPINRAELMDAVRQALDNPPRQLA